MGIREVVMLDCIFTWCSKCLCGGVMGVCCRNRSARWHGKSLNCSDFPYGEPRRTEQTGRHVTALEGKVHARDIRPGRRLHKPRPTPNFLCPDFLEKKDPILSSA